MNLDLKNKNAIVCGSTQGIGEAAAIELAKLGANITLIARNESKLLNVLNEFDKSNSVIINLQLNKNNEKKSIDHSEQNSELFFQDIGNIEEISENKFMCN